MHRKWIAIWSIALFALATGDSLASSDTEVITHEQLRQTVLGVVFPRMKVSVKSGRKVAESEPKNVTRPGRPSYPDALSSEVVYKVSGPAANEAERCASENLLTEVFSEDREVRLKVFRWPGKPDTELLALTQYSFSNANPAGSCWSIGLLVHLVLSGQAWYQRDAYLLETQHHTSIQRVELIDLGSTLPELVVESDFGGAGTLGSTLQVFSLGDGRFDEILSTESRLEADIEVGYAQELDIAETRTERGKRFRVNKKTYFEKGTWFNKPRVSLEFYGRGSGVDIESVGSRQKMLGLLK